MRRYSAPLIILTTLAAFLLGRLSVDGGIAWGMGRTTSATPTWPSAPGSAPSSAPLAISVSVLFPTPTPAPPTPTPKPTAVPTADPWDIFDPTNYEPGRVYRTAAEPAPTMPPLPNCLDAPPGKLCTAPTGVPDDGATSGEEATG